MSREQVTDGVLVARAGLSRLFEPCDNLGAALVCAAGPEEAFAVAAGRHRASAALRETLAQVLDAAGIAPRAGLLETALQRWRPRVQDLAPERDLMQARRLGGRLLVPEDPQWPGALDDLQLAAPICLWLRGGLSGPLPGPERMAALVGSRDCTGYGATVAGDLAAGLVTAGWTVVSGGAYGIDAHAHRAALAAGLPDRPATVAVMACGTDRFYPAGNEDLLRSVAARGLLLAEVPPGSAPTRWRFLQRNRIIAALCGITVVAEARWRSGALNTAHHAAGLGRPVGAVPGSVYSASSAGCHRLLRDGSAVCVTDSREVLELAGPPGQDTAPTPDGGSAVHDGLDPEDIMLLDALPVRASSTVEKLAAVAGLSPAAVRAGLGRLELSGAAERGAAGGWRRRR